MAPLYGWGVKGRRLRGFAPHGHWRTLTFVGALRADCLTAPCVFDGPINGQCFKAHVEQQLIPTLRPGDIVVMDNLGSHKSADTPVDQGCRRKALVSAALFTRPQSNRASLRQDQALHAKSANTHHRRHLAISRLTRPHNRSRRMHQLPPQRWLRFKQNMKCSSPEIGIRISGSPVRIPSNPLIVAPHPANSAI